MVFVSAAAVAAAIADVSYSTFLFNYVMYLSCHILCTNDSTIFFPTLVKRFILLH